ncbi:hypothetical protein Slala05_54630 [Streptomyces lavendulae subsp. lavendulae]|nr:hypothetical protein Slala05_54630 [Streptomyces lavendulae subsp. lavendulae]
MRYAPRLIGRHSTADACTATVVGRHCEAGDVPAADVELPGDIHPRCRTALKDRYRQVAPP